MNELYNITLSKVWQHIFLYKCVLFCNFLSIEEKQRIYLRNLHLIKNINYKQIISH